MNDVDIFIAAGFGNIFYRLGIDGKAFVFCCFTSVNIGIGGGIDNNIRF